jgi:hypothetical protein
LVVFIAIAHNSSILFGKGFGPRNVRLLGFLVAAAEQQHDRLAALRKIDPVSGTVVDAQFVHTIANGFDVSKVAECQPGNADEDLGARRPIAKADEPALKSPSA